MVESPPDSTPMFSADGTLPTSGKLGVDNCSFAIELLAIVAMFVFSLFLPILVFALQLWWMLLLRFCWPGNSQASAQLQAWFSAPIGTGSHAPPADADELEQLQAAKDLFNALGGATSEPSPPGAGTPLPEVHDPLCGED